MTIIGKIREKSGWAIGIVATGLILFILGGDLFSTNSILRGGNDRNAGEIAGEKIPIEKFESELNELKYTYYLNSNKAPGEAENQQFIPQAWNQLLFKIAYQKEFDKLGIVVGKEETIDMVQGRNIHPAIYQSFRNQRTGQFDRNMIINYLQNISKMDQKQQAVWFNFEKQLAPDRLRTKYQALIQKSVYVTKAEAKREFDNSNKKSEAKVLVIPYSIIADKDITLNDDVIAEYVEKNKNRFSTDESANIEYVSFSIMPSKADTINFFVEMKEIIADFKKTPADEDSLFVALNADNPTNPGFINPGEMPKELSSIGNLKKDSVYGPIFEMGSYKIFKVGEIKSDTAFAARASHILFRWDSESAEDKKKTLDKAKEVLSRIKKGERFELMARQFGTDGTAQQGGDLGWFGQGRMVKEFEAHVFGATKKGIIDNPIETQFGYHILKVTETKTNKKYYIAAIDKVITAGDETRDSVYTKAETLAMQSKDLAGMDAYIAANPTLGIQKVAAPNINPTSTYVNNLTNPKELIRWVFNEAKEGNISPVNEIDNQFIVAGLKNKYEKGKVNLESIKFQIAYQVGNEKKGEKIIEMIGAENTNLDDAAKKAGNNITPIVISDISLSAGTLGSMGYEPEATGTVFGLKKGQTSKAIKGNSGIILIQANVDVPVVPAIADYSMFKNQLIQMNNSKNEMFINEAIKSKSNIVDNRYKYF
jgi:peptidyl-prolyl cis-trans isomerase D